MTLFILQKRIFIAVAIAATLAMMPLAAGADTYTGGTGSTYTGSSGSTYTGSSGSTYTGSGQPANCGTGPCAVQNPLTVTSVCGLLHTLFNAVVAIGIPVAVLFIIWAGFKFVLAQGKEKELRQARQNFMFVVIGIAIFLGAWILATAIAATVNAIGGANLIQCN